VPVSELEELSLLVELDSLSLTILEEAGLPVEEGDWQDIVQTTKAKQTKATRMLIFFMPLLLYLLVGMIGRNMEKVNLPHRGKKLAYLIR
jgi:hypothetical protein